MNFLENLFQNEAIKKAAFANLIKVMRENNVSQVLVKVNEQDELDLEFIKTDSVIIPATDLEYYQTLVQKQLEL